MANNPNVAALLAALGLGPAGGGPPGQLGGLHLHGAAAGLPPKLLKYFLRRNKKPSVMCRHEFCRKTILIKSVPYSMTKQKLWRMFSRYGELHDVQFLVNFKTKKFTNLVLVRYIFVDHALNVLRLPHTKFRYNGGCMRAVANRCLYPKPEDIKKKKDKPVNAADGLNEEEQICHINKLPSELLNVLFSYLEYDERIRIESVCVYWRYVNTQIPWANMRVLRFEKKYNRITKKKLTMAITSAILKRCGSTVREINLMSCRHRLSYDFVGEVAKYCPNLETLNCYGTKIKIHAMRIFATNCSKLKTLCLPECKNVIDMSIWWVLKKLQIESLDLSSLKKITGESFYLFKDCLTFLNLNGCSDITPESFMLLQKCEKIRVLKINDCARLNMESLRVVFKELRHLEELHMGGQYPNLSSALFSALIHYAKNVKFLSFEHNRMIGDLVTIDSLTEYCQKLETLNLGGTSITNLTLNHLHKLPNLRNIYISYNNISNDGVRELCNCPNLERIATRGINEIGDVGCIQMLHCTKLKVLDISGCHFVTNAVVLEALNLDRTEDEPLKIFAGGTAITNHVNEGHLKVSKVNKCPPRYRPFLSYEGQHAMVPELVDM